MNLNFPTLSSGKILTSPLSTLSILTLVTNFIMRYLILAIFYQKVKTLFLEEELLKSNLRLLVKLLFVNLMEDTLLFLATMRDPHLPAM